MRRSSYALLACVLALFLWMGMASERLSEAYPFATHADDGYNRLAEGFRAGHLYLDVKVDMSGPVPRPWLSDYTLYHGRYYIYFGILPELLLFYPFLMLTGHEFPQGGAVVLFAFLALLVQCAILRDAKRRYFPELSALAETLLVLFLAFASLAPDLISHSLMYEVASGAAYLFLSLAWWALYRALHAPERWIRWYGWGSLFFGCAAACRPTMVAALPVLALAAWLDRSRLALAKDRIRLLAATLVPAASLGLLIAGYNYARFGNALDFGFKNQLNPSVLSGKPLSGLRYLPWNLRWYCLTPPNFTPYFPYFLPVDTSRQPADYVGIDDVQGQCATSLLLLIVAATWLWLRRKRGTSPTALAGFAGLVLLGGATVAIPNLILAFRADRYQVDFQASLVLAVALGLGYVLPRLPAPGRALVLALLAFAAVSPELYALAAGKYNPFADHHPRSSPVMERLGNYPSYLAAKLGWIHYGPRVLKVTFPSVSAAQVETLLGTGVQAGHDSVVVVRRGGPAAFGIEHQTSEALSSGWLPVEPGRVYTLEVDMGSLYPPRQHPFFHGWTEKEIDRVKTTARLAVDGREIIRSKLPFFDSPPGNVLPGRAAESLASPFSGTILSFARLPLRDFTRDPAFVEPGIYRAKVVMGDWPGTTDPILTNGLAQAGNCLFVELLPGRHIRFALDCWGYGLQRSEVLHAPEGPHELQVFCGAQASVVHPDLLAPQAGALDRTLCVWWDGRLAWVVQVRGPATSYADAAFGANSAGFGEVGPTFTGGFERRAYTPDEAEAFVRENREALARLRSATP